MFNHVINVSKLCEYIFNHLNSCESQSSVNVEPTCLANFILPQEAMTHRIHLALTIAPPKNVMSRIVSVNQRNGLKGNLHESTHESIAFPSNSLKGSPAIAVVI